MTTAAQRVVRHPSAGRLVKRTLTSTMSPFTPTPVHLTPLRTSLGSPSLLSSPLRASPHRLLSTSTASTALPPPTAAPSNSLSLAALAAVIAAIAAGVYEFSPAIADATPVKPGAPGGAPGLDSKNFTALKLKSIEPYNHNSHVFTFALPDPNSYLNLPVSSCVMTRFKGEDGKDVIRPYTPIDTHRKGEVVLLVKVYPTGAMSQHIAHLKVGDTLDFKGPMPKLKYEANMKKKLGLIAGGSGITPMLQLLEEVARNPQDKTQVHLTFANVSPKDILMKETLDALSSRNRNIHVTYVIDAKDTDWQGEVGHINKDMIKKTIPFTPKDGKDVLIYVCGPPGMMKAVSGDKAKDYSQGEVDGALKELGFSKDQVYKF